MGLPTAVTYGDTTYPLVGVPIDTTGSGDFTLVPAEAGKVIKMWRVFVVATVATEFRWKSGAANSLSGNLPIPSGAAFVLDVGQAPWFTTLPGEALVLNNATASDLNGMLAYTVEPAY
jgi:hypothetical protein